MSALSSNDLGVSSGFTMVAPSEALSFLSVSLNLNVDTFIIFSSFRTNPSSLCSSISFKRSTNSSPPNLAATSSVLMFEMRVLPIERSAASPARCSRVLLIFLKLSMSTKMTPNRFPSFLNSLKNFLRDSSR